MTPGNDEQFGVNHQHAGHRNEEYNRNRQNYNKSVISRKLVCASDYIPAVYGITGQRLRQEGENTAHC